jgi:hypothetical protein
MKPHRGYILIFALLFLCTPVAAQSSQADENIRLFSTGHRVSGEFLAFCNSVDDPERIFGEPITEVLQDPLHKNIQFQYFQRVRMDYDLSKPSVSG